MHSGSSLEGEAKSKITSQTNGTNFIAAEKELKAGMKERNLNKTEKTLQQKCIFKPSPGAHHGGFWERVDF